jgi:3-deoxy-D-manno-octulosonic-acid transferase
MTSAKVAAKKLPSKAIHQYVPIENYFAVRRFLKYWQPTLTIFVESEFWPCILSETAPMCKVISLSTRTSNASFERWSWCKSFTREVLGNISVFMPQSVDDAKKLKLLGFNNIKYFGHLKYSVPPLPYSAVDVEKLKKEMQGRKILLFASTHPGEEEIAADIYKELRAGEQSLLMLIAVRHPVRAEGVRAMLESRGYKVAVRSKAQEIVSETDIYLIDTIGELGTFFKVAPITIMGGSFVDGIGGHNIIEPAKLRSVVIVGPYMSNFKGICQDFKEASAAIFVEDKAKCIKAVKSLWKDSKTYKSCRDNALMLFKDKEDVLEKTLDYIVKYYL